MRPAPTILLLLLMVPCHTPSSPFGSTHFCYTPLFWDAVFGGAYRAVRRALRAPDTASLAATPAAHTHTRLDGQTGAALPVAVPVAVSRQHPIMRRPAGREGRRGAPAKAKGGGGGGSSGGKRSGGAKRGGRGSGGKIGGRSGGKEPGGAGAASSPASAPSGHLSKLKKLVRDDFLKLRAKLMMSESKRAEQRRSLSRLGGGKVTPMAQQPLTQSGIGSRSRSDGVDTWPHAQNRAPGDAAQTSTRPWLAPSPRLWGGSAP
jgi:hypothetical protein